MKTIAFFNNNGRVGTTSVVYHLAWMYADLGMTVVAADLDPRANLTSMFLDESRIEELWPDGHHRRTLFGAIQPLLEGAEEIAPAHVEDIADNIGLLVGDVSMSALEEELNSQWSDALDGKPRAFRVLSAFWQVMRQAAEKREAELMLIDVGPNLGAINRTALIAAEHVIIPLAPDLYSLEGLRNLGPALRRWRGEWAERRDRNPVSDLPMPSGRMLPTGYVVLQPVIRLDRPMTGYDRWMSRIPVVYREAVLDEPVGPPMNVGDDPYCLATLRHYPSLMPLAQEARKPMFFLKAADGALGGHAQAVQECYRDFRALARAIADRSGLPLS